MRFNLGRLFTYSAICILIATGVGKLVTMRHLSQVFLTYDPVFGLRLWQLIEIAGAFEIISALVCMVIKTVTLRCAAIAWIGTILLAYRIALVALHYEGPCGCLGVSVLATPSGEAVWM